MIGLAAIDESLAHVRAKKTLGLSDLLKASVAVDSWLWAMLPLSWRTRGLSGWLSCELVLSQRLFASWGESEKTFDIQLNALRSIALRGVWCSSTHWPLLSVVNAILSDSGHYDKEEHHQRQLFNERRLEESAKGDYVNEVLSLEEIETLFLNHQWPMDGMLKTIFLDIVTLGESTEELQRASLSYANDSSILMEKETISDAEKIARGSRVGKALIILGDAWKVMYERLVAHHGIYWQGEVDHGLEASRDMMDVGLKALLYYRSAIRWFDESLDLSIEKNSVALDMKARAEHAWLELGNVLCCALGLWSPEINGDYAQMVAHYKKLLVLIRENMREKLIVPLSIYPQEDEAWLALSGYMTHIMEEMQRALKDYLAMIWQDLSDLFRQTLGAWPCAYGVVGYGSLEKGTCTLYSDIEFGVVLAEDTPVTRDYARRVSYAFALLIQGLGETPLPISEFAKESDSVSSFDLDKYLPSGLCLDLGMKVALGRRYDAANVDPALWGTLKYELIGDIDKLVKYLDKDYFAIDALLPVELMACTSITGDSVLIADYQTAIYQAWLRNVCIDDLNPELGVAPMHAVRALSLLNGVVDGTKLLLRGDFARYRAQLETFCAGQLYDVKRDIYRIPDRLCDDIAMYYGIQGKHLGEKLHQLEEAGVWDASQTTQLCIMMTIANVLRLEAYQYYGSQCETMSVLPRNPIDNEKSNDVDYRSTYEERLVRFYKTAIPFQEALKVWLDNCGLDVLSSMSYWDHASFYDDSVLVTVKIAYRLMQYDEVLTILHAFYDELDFDAKEISEKAEVAFAHFYLESLLRRWEEVIASDFHDGEISTYSLGHIMRVAGLVLGVLDRLGDRLELLIEKDRVPKNSTPKKSFFFGRKKAENPKMVIQKSIAPINRFEALTLFCQMGVLLDKALLLIDKIEALLKSVGALLLVGSVYSLFEFNVKDFLAAMALGVFGVGAGGLGLMVAGVKQLYVKLLRFYANDYKFIYDSKTDDTPALIALLGDAWYIKANLERRSGKVANAEYAYYRAKAIYAEPLFLTDAQKLISVLAGLAHLHAAQNDTSMKKLACQEFEAVIHLQNEIYGKGVHLAVYEIKRAWLSTYGQLITQEKFSNTKDKERYTQEYIKMCYEYKEFFKKSTKFNQIIGGMSEALKGNFVNLDIDWDKDEQPIAALNAGAWQHAVALSRKKLKEDNDVENITSALGTLLDVFATNTPAKNKLTAGKTTSQLNCKAGKAVQLLLNDIANWLVDEGYHDLYKNLSDLVDVAVGSVPVNNTLIDARAFIIVLIDFCFPIRTFDMAFTLRWFSMILKCQDHILQADACDETATLLLAAEVCETSSTHTTTTVGFFPPATPLSTQTSEAANPMLLASSKTVNHK